MDNDSLLALFRKLALASAPLLTAGCSNATEGGCDFPTEQTTVSLASLQADAGAADAGTDGGLADLCAKAVPPYERILTCEVVSANGQPAVHVVYKQYCLGGRRPAGLLTPSSSAAESGLASWLANMAHLEAASVDAFDILACDLEAHEAPRSLTLAARASAADERRHARVMDRLAVAVGARPPRARVVRGALRDLEAVATENAVEGCVRETFAALVACRQARAAADPTIRRAMRGIAPDETRHAALSWTIDTWASGRLSEAARRRVRDARRETTSRLLGELAVSEPVALRVPAGLPDGTEAVQMASALFARLT